MCLAHISFNPASFLFWVLQIVHLFEKYRNELKLHRDSSISQKINNNLVNGSRVKDLCRGDILWKLWGSYDLHLIQELTCSSTELSGVKDLKKNQESLK